MPSFGDSAFIFLLALLLFGPKKLPELARQLGKLMAEFRRASNEFRMQMEDELRISDQAEQQKKIAAMEAAAPVTPALENNIAALNDTAATPDFTEPHFPPPKTEQLETQQLETQPLPIATEGELSIMPPSTGLPAARSSESAGNEALTPVLDAIPHVPDPELAANLPSTPSTDHYAIEQHPDRHTGSNPEPTPSEAPLHG